MKLKKYLECEILLQKFFEKINYCKNNCTNQTTSKFSKHVRGNVGCCLHNFYNFTKKLNQKQLSILNKARIKKYGLPENKEPRIQGLEKPCEYHTSKGCILKDHKGLSCISFICKPYQDHLKEKYNIDYDYDEIRDFLEDILLDKIDDNQLIEFRSMVNNWIEKINH